ncbi:MAG: O-antigen polymerase [Limisphaerales bacterium]
MLGTIAAILVIPERIEPAGELKLASAFLALGLVMVSAVLVLVAPASLFHPVHVTVAAPVYWVLLDLLQGAYDLPGLGKNQVVEAFMAIGLFSGGVWVAALKRPWALPRAVSNAAMIRLGGKRLFTLAIVAFTLSFLKFAIPAGFDLWAMVGAFSESRWAAPWMRGTLGGWEAFLDHAAYFGFLLPALTVLVGRQIGWVNWRTWMCGLFCVVIIALMSTGGGRGKIGVMVGSALTVWFLSARRPLLRHLLIVTAVSAGLLFFMQQMVQTRHLGVAAMFSKSADHNITSLDYLHVDDNFLRLSQIIDIIPNQHPHTGIQWLVWLAVRPVPRVFWPGKPTDSGFDLPGYLGMEGVSLSCSIIGEAYMAFGFLGCLVTGWVMGRLAVSLAQMLELHSGPAALAIFGSGLLALFAGVRSGLDLVLMGYPVLAWIALVWVHQHFQSLPKHSAVGSNKTIQRHEKPPASTL